MRFGHLLTACVFSAYLSAHAESDSSPPLKRAQSVINAFQVMCTLELPKFDDISAKATAMRMQLQSDSKTPTAGGAKTRQKAWGGGLTTGPFALFLDEMAGPKGTATGCAVAAEVPDVDAFRTEAINTMKLALMKAPELGADGSRSYVWDGVYGPGTTLILRDFKPYGKPGAILKLLSMQRQ
ncbi:MAG TPA: hypothetical protein VJ001_03580 [Rhodocyclaceae bacterium]|nr:hypothetical protein [Rhodocyclaceae bacterium]